MAAPELETIKAAALARLYDVDLIEDPGDVESVSGPCRSNRRSGPGTGRGIRPRDRPTSRRGLRGRRRGLGRLDARPGCRRSRGGRAEASGRLELVEADLLGLALPGGARFQLAILALNSILLMGTIEDQSAALETMARHLAPGGLAVVDVWLPNGRRACGL